jgi:hypothetical protein
VHAPTYALARPAAAAVSAFLARHRDAHDHGAAAAPPPDADDLAAIVDAAFWTSLRREETYRPRISLAYLPPEAAGEPLLLEQAIPLLPDALVRLAPAVERPGIHLGVWPGEEGALQVWGATRTLPDLTLVLEVVEPGLVVVKYRRGATFGKFGNVAVLQANQMQVVDERGASIPDCPGLLTTLLAVDVPASWRESGHELVQLAISMRAHGRGGLLLVVPDGSEEWRESIVRPVLYSVAPAFTRLARLVARREAAGEDPAWRDEVRRAIDGVAGLTAVDGATVVTRGLELLAFGAKIGRRDGGAQVATVTLTHPVHGDVARQVSPSRLGGTRHLSAAQFVHDQRDALALVASQDGRFTIFAWSPCEGTVHAHRIETLLM